MSFVNPVTAIEFLSYTVSNTIETLSPIAKSLIYESFGIEEDLHSWIELSNSEVLALHYETPMPSNLSPNSIDDVLMYMALEEGYLFVRLPYNKIVLNIKEKAYTFE